MIVDTCLLHDPICDMMNFDCPVYYYDSACYWAEPNIMISLTTSHKITAMFPQYFAYLLFILRHYAMTD